MHGDLEYERHGKGTCDLHCSGDDDQTCGGHYAFDLYKLSSPAAADDDEYVACFNDVKADRIMDEETMITRDDMTPEICRDHCIDSYSIFYGLQVCTSFYRCTPCSLDFLCSSVNGLAAPAANGRCLPRPKALITEITKRIFLSTADH